MAVVLVADDEPAIRSLVSAVLGRAGYQVLVASNGVEAVALFRSSPDRIDLVLTDIAMPMMDGYHVVQLIRATKPTARIVCMTAFAAHGPPPGVAILSKPFTAEALRNCVVQALAGA